MKAQILSRSRGEKKFLHGCEIISGRGRPGYEVTSQEGEGILSHWHFEICSGTLWCIEAHVSSIFCDGLTCGRLRMEWRLGMRWEAENGVETGNEVGGWEWSGDWE